jgi:uncharacterized protein (DUF1330 family)
MTPQPAYAVLQGRLKPGGEDLYARYLEGTRPLLLEYGVRVDAVGAGIESAHATACWPINGVLRFPSAEALRGFFADPRYAEIRRRYRDAAYEVLELSFFEGRAPRT